MDYRCSIPVLMIGFNRPDNFAKVFAKVRAAQPKKLYIAIDGAREDREGESILVEQSKKVVEKIDWECEVFRHYNDVNLGAENTISSALRWICEDNDYFICLEDDIIVPISFFKFMEEMLIKYKDDCRISSVSGNNFTPLKTPNGEDYFFCRFGHSWGWGSWKREYENMQLDVEIKEEHCSLNFCRTITSSEAEAKHFSRLFTYLRNQGVGNCTWDFVALYQHRIKGQLSIVPRVNLAMNIGVEGLHARGRTKYHFVPYDETFEVKKHPKEVKCWSEYDIYHFKNHFPQRRNIIIRCLKFFKRKFFNYCEFFFK